MQVIRNMNKSATFIGTTEHIHLEHGNIPKQARQEKFHIQTGTLYPYKKEKSLMNYLFILKSLT